MSDGDRREHSNLAPYSQAVRCRDGRAEMCTPFED